MPYGATIDQDGVVTSDIKVGIERERYGNLPSKSRTTANQYIITTEEGLEVSPYALF
jgi:hypothetical protein